MELDEMKNLWNELSEDLEKQKNLTDKLIIQMTQERYQNKLNKISFPEKIGAFICFIFGGYLLYNLPKFDTWYMLVCGIFSAAYFFILPIVVLRSVNSMKRINIANANYKQMIQEFAESKNRFLFLQKVGIILNFVLMIAMVTIAGKLFNNDSSFFDSKNWIWQLPLMFLGLLLFSRWGFRYYSKITNQAGDLLKELKE